MASYFVEPYAFEGDADYQYFDRGGALSEEVSYSGNEHNRMFTHIGGEFVLSHFTTGTGQSLDGRSVIAADLDRDGDQDLILRNLKTHSFQVLRNNLPPQNRAVIVKLRNRKPNTAAIGARVTLTCNGHQQLRQVTAGDSYLGQSPPELHFGLGSCQQDPSLRITWPDGQSESVTVPANTVSVVQRAQGVVSHTPLKERSPE